MAMCHNCRITIAWQVAEENEEAAVAVSLSPDFKEQNGRLHIHYIYKPVIDRGSTFEFSPGGHIYTPHKLSW